MSDIRRPDMAPDRDRAEPRAPGRPEDRPRPPSTRSISVAGEPAARPAKCSCEVGNVELRSLDAYYGINHAVRGVSIDLRVRQR